MASDPPFAVLHTESSTRFGGQELRTIMEMEGLAGFGISSYLFAPTKSEILRLAMEKGLPASPMEFNANLNPAEIARLVKFIRSKKVSVVNSHGSKDAWNGGPAALLSGAAFIRSRHIGSPVRNNLFSRLIYGRLPDLTLTTSRSIAEGLEGIGVDPSQLKVIPTGVDIIRFSPPEDKTALRSTLGILPEVPVIGFVGVMRQDKGVPILLEAFGRVLIELPAARLLLVGSGIQDRLIRASIDALGLGASVIHLGYRQDVQIPLGAMDVFVHPAIRPEGIPQTILQAMAIGVPVVATSIGGVDEVARNNETAVTVDPGDAAALAKAIVDMVKDRYQSERLRDAALKMARREYSLNGMMADMAGIYRSFRDNRRRERIGIGA